MLYALAIVSAVLFLILDQLSKFYILNNFALGQSEPFINGVIDFTFIYNKGGAWGLMNGHTWLLLGMTVIIMLVCVALLIKNGFRNKLLFWSICLILSGGLGNMIDRIFRSGKVVDFIHLHFMPQFPVFNIADCAVCIGAGLLLVYFVLDIIKDRNTHKQNELMIKELQQRALNNTENDA